MTAQERHQDRLFDVPDTEYGTITVPNGELFRFLRLASAMVDECRLKYDGETFHIRANDPPVVGIIDVSYTPDVSMGESFEVGINLSRAVGQLQNKPRDSNVTVTFAEPKHTVSIEQTHDEQVWDVQEQFRSIDPDSIRKEPDEPDVALETQARLNTTPFHAFIRGCEDGKEITFEASGESVHLIERKKGDPVSGAHIENADVSGGATSRYPLDYINSVTTAAYVANIDTLAAAWNDEYPIMFEFADDYIEGHYMVAPRIKQ